MAFGKHELAIRDFDGALRLSPNDAGLKQRRAEAYEAIASQSTSNNECPLGACGHTFAHSQRALAKIPAVRTDSSLIGGKHHGSPTMFRELLAFATTAFVTVLAGRLVAIAGFGFLPMCLILSIACPISVCIIPRRNIPLHAVLVNLGWHFFLFVSLDSASPHHTPAGAWLISVLLLAVSLFPAAVVGRLAAEIHAGCPT